MFGRRNCGTSSKSYHKPRRLSIQTLVDRQIMRTDLPPPLGISVNPEKQVAIQLHAENGMLTVAGAQQSGEVRVHVDGDNARRLSANTGQQYTVPTVSG